MKSLKTIICVFVWPFFLSIAVRAGAQSRPLIGITSVFECTDADTVGQLYTNMSYINAVLEAGGTPIVLPPVHSEETIDDYIVLLDGLVLVGGKDIPPHAYAEKAHPTVDSLSARRFWFESRLISAWLNECEKPILGICLGCQFTNVMLGGSLIQDILSEIGEKINHRHEKGAVHDITIQSDSRLFAILGEESCSVNSYHHQAVDQVGNNLKVVARAPDGVIEALELSGDRFGLLVQWHPERLPLEHRSKIFGAFITASRKE